MPVFRLGQICRYICGLSYENIIADRLQCDLQLINVLRLRIQLVEFLNFLKHIYSTTDGFGGHDPCQ